MNTFIILLRAVNVSGTNIIKMEMLRNLLLIQGFQNVQTYIQRGNIILQTKQKAQEVKHLVKESIRQHLGAR